MQKNISSVILERTVTDGGTSQSRLNKDGSSDQRKHNCGSAKRTVYTVQQKWDMIEDCEHWLSKNEGSTLQKYIKTNNLSAKMKDYLSTNKNGWQYPVQRSKIYNSVKDATLKKFKVPNRRQVNRTKFPLMESALKQEIIERRKRKARVSSMWMKQRARKICRYYYPESNFSATQG